MANGRGQWGSRLGFILAAAGSAVGLGNIWSFPYRTGENGGGLFVIVYLLCVALIGLPVMMAEIFIGRTAQTSPVGKKIGPVVGAKCLQQYLYSLHLLQATHEEEEGPGMRRLLAGQCIRRECIRRVGIRYEIRNVLNGSCHVQAHVQVFLTAEPANRDEGVNVAKRLF